MGAIVAGVAHELNTPIGNARIVATTIADNCRLLEAAATGGSLTRTQLSNFIQAQCDGAALLDDSLERAATLIASFKNVSVDQSSGLIRMFNLRTVVQDNLDTMSPGIRRHPCAIVIENSVDSDLDLQSFPFFSVALDTVGIFRIQTLSCGRFRLESVA